MTANEERRLNERMDKLGAAFNERINALEKKADERCVRTCRAITDKLEALQEATVGAAIDHATLKDIKLDFYGRPGENGDRGTVGVKGHVHSLLQSRWMVRIGLTGLWAVVIAILSALLPRLFGG